MLVNNVELKKNEIWWLFSSGIIVGRAALMLQRNFNVTAPKGDSCAKIGGCLGQGFGVVQNTPFIVIFSPQGTNIFFEILLKILWGGQFRVKKLKWRIGVKF